MEYSNVTLADEITLALSEGHKVVCVYDCVIQVGLTRQRSLNLNAMKIWQSGLFDLETRTRMLKAESIAGRLPVTKLVTSYMKLLMTAV